MINTQTIRELALIMRETGLTRLDITDEGSRITLELGSTAAIPVKSAESGQVCEAPAQPINESGTAVKAPLVGTVYLAPKPGEAPFVSVGSEVKAGDVLCTVEAMKMFNEIKAPHDGIVKTLCVKNGQAVAYGEKLFVIERA